MNADMHNHTHEEYLQLANSTVLPFDLNQFIETKPNADLDEHLDQLEDEHAGETALGRVRTCRHSRSMAANILTCTISGLSGDTIGPLKPAQRNLHKHCIF